MKVIILAGGLGTRIAEETESKPKPMVLIDDKPILWHLMNKTLRYNEIHKLIPKATDKMLAQQLRELEKDGLINRKVYPVVPPKTEYSLTKFGETLTPILDELCNWGEQYLIQK